MKDSIIYVDSNRESSSHQNGVQITDLNVKMFWRSLQKKQSCELKMFQATVKDLLDGVKAVKARELDLKLEGGIGKSQVHFKI